LAPSAENFNNRQQFFCSFGGDVFEGAGLRVALALNDTTPAPIAEVAGKAKWEISEAENGGTH